MNFLNGTTRALFGANFSYYVFLFEIITTIAEMLLFYLVIEHYKTPHKLGLLIAIFLGNVFSFFLGLLMSFYFYGGI